MDRTAKATEGRVEATERRGEVTERAASDG